MLEANKPDPFRAPSWASDVMSWISYETPSIIFVIVIARQTYESKSKTL